MGDIQRAFWLEVAGHFPADSPLAAGLPERVHVFDAKLAATQQGLVLGEAALQQAVTDVLAMCAVIDARLRSKGKSAGAFRGGMAAAARNPTGEGSLGFGAPTGHTDKERRPRGSRGERGRHTLDEDCNHAARVLGSDIDASFAPLAVLEWLPSWEALCVMAAGDEELKRDLHQLVVDISQGVPGLLPSFSAHPLTRIDAPQAGEGCNLPYLSPAVAAIAADPTTLSLHMPTYMTGDAAPLLGRLRKALVARDRRAALKNMRAAELLAAGAAAEVPLALLAELDTERCLAAAAGTAMTDDSDVQGAEASVADSPRFKVLRNAVQLMYAAPVPGAEGSHTPGPTLVHAADDFVLTAYPLGPGTLAGATLAPGSIPSDAVTSPRRRGAGDGLQSGAPAVTAAARCGPLDTAAAITLTQGHLYVTTPGARGGLDVAQAVANGGGFSTGASTAVDDRAPPGLTFADGLQLGNAWVPSAAPLPVAAPLPRPALPTPSAEAPAAEDGGLGSNPAAASSSLLEGASPASFGTDASTPAIDGAGGVAGTVGFAPGAATDVESAGAATEVAGAGEPAEKVGFPPRTVPEVAAPATAATPPFGEPLLERLYHQHASAAGLASRLGGLRVTALATGTPAAAEGCLRVHDVVVGVVTAALPAADLAQQQEAILSGTAGSTTVVWGSGPRACAPGAPPGAACLTWDAAALQQAAAAATGQSRSAWLLVARPCLAVALEASLRGMTLEECLASCWVVPAAASASAGSGEAGAAGGGLAPPLPLPGALSCLPGGEALEAMGAETAALDETSPALYEPGTGRYLGYHVTGRLGTDSALINCKRRPPPPAPGSAAALALAAAGSTAAAAGGAGDANGTGEGQAAGASAAPGAGVGADASAPPAKLAGKKRPSSSKGGTKTPKAPKPAAAAPAVAAVGGEGGVAAAVGEGDAASAPPTTPAAEAGAVQEQPISEPPAKRRKLVVASPAVDAARVTSAAVPASAPGSAMEVEGEGQEAAAAADAASSVASVASSHKSPATTQHKPSLVPASASSQKTGPVFVNLGDAAARLVMVDSVVRFSSAFAGSHAVTTSTASSSSSSSDGNSGEVNEAGEPLPPSSASEATGAADAAAPAPAPAAPAALEGAQMCDDQPTGPSAASSEATPSAADAVSEATAPTTLEAEPATNAAPDVPCPPSLEGRVTDAWAGLDPVQLAHTAKALLEHGISRRDVLIAAVRAEWWMSRLVMPQNAHGTFVLLEGGPSDVNLPLPCRASLRLVLRHTTAPVLRRLVNYIGLPAAGDKQILLNRIFSYLVSASDAPEELLRLKDTGGSDEEQSDGDTVMRPADASSSSIPDASALRLDVAATPAGELPWGRTFEPLSPATYPWMATIPRSGLVFLPPYDALREAVLLRWFYPAPELLRAVPEAFGLPAAPRTVEEMGARAAQDADALEGAGDEGAASAETPALEAPAVPPTPDPTVAALASLAGVIDSAVPVSMISGTSRSGRARKPSSRVLDAVADTLAAATLRAAAAGSSGSSSASNKKTPSKAGSASANAGGATAAPQPAEEGAEAAVTAAEAPAADAAAAPAVVGAEATETETAPEAPGAEASTAPEESGAAAPAALETVEQDAPAAAPAAPPADVKPAVEPEAEAAAPVVADTAAAAAAPAVAVAGDAPVEPAPAPLAPLPTGTPPFRFGQGLALPLSRGGVIVQGPGQAFFFCTVAPAATPGAPAAHPIPTQHAVAAGLTPRNTPPGSFVPVAAVSPTGVVTLLAAGATAPGPAAPGTSAGASSGAGAGKARSGAASGGSSKASSAPTVLIPVGSGSEALSPAGAAGGATGTGSAPAAPKPKSGGGKSGSSGKAAAASASAATDAAGGDGAATAAAPAVQLAAPSPANIPASKLPPKLLAAAQAVAMDPSCTIVTTGRLRKHVSSLAAAAKAAASQRARAGAASPLSAFPPLSDDVDGTTRWLVQDVPASGGAAAATATDAATPAAPAVTPGVILPGAPRGLSTLAAVLATVVVATVGDVTTSSTPGAVPPEALVLPLSGPSPLPRVPLHARFIVSARLPDARFTVARAVVDVALASPLAFPLAAMPTSSSSSSSASASAAALAGAAVHVCTGHSLLYEIYDEPALAASPRGHNALHPYAVKLPLPLAANPRMLLRKAVSTLGPLLRRFLARRPAAAEAFVAEAHAAAAGLRAGLLLPRSLAATAGATVARLPLCAAAARDVTVCVMRPSKTGLLGGTAGAAGARGVAAAVGSSAATDASVSPAQATESTAPASPSAAPAAPPPPLPASSSSSSSSSSASVLTDDRPLPVIGAHQAALELVDVHCSDAPAPAAPGAVTTLVELVRAEDLGAAAAAEAADPASPRLLGRYLAAPRPFLALWRGADGEQELAGAFAVLASALAASWECSPRNSAAAATPPPGIAGSLPLRTRVPSCTACSSPAATVEVARRRTAALISEFAGMGLFALASTLALWVPLDLQPREGEEEDAPKDEDDPMTGSSGALFAGWRFPCAMPSAGISAGSAPPSAPPALPGTSLLLAGGAGAEGGLESAAAAAERAHAWALWQLQRYVIEGSLVTPMGQTLVAPSAVATHVRFTLVQAATCLVGPPPVLLPPAPALVQTAPA